MLGNAPVIVADRCDGAALTDANGPVRLVAAGDKRGARSVRQLDPADDHRAGPRRPPPTKSRGYLPTSTSLDLIMAVTLSPMASPKIGNRLVGDAT